LTYTNPIKGEEVVYIPQMVIMLLQEAKLLSRVAGFDPLQTERNTKKTEPDNPIYRRRDIHAMDDTLFVSEGTTKDGRTVGLKVSDRTQAEIDKVSVIAKRGAHLL